MTIVEGIDTKITEAMRSKDSVTVGTLRMLKSSLKNASIAAQGELSDEQAVSVLQKEVKLRQDAASSYDAADRGELADKERGEIEIIKQFLPEAPSEEQVKQAVADAIKSVGASEMAQMGAVIGAAKASLGMGADGALIAAEAKRQLAGG